MSIRIRNRGTKKSNIMKFRPMVMADAEFMLTLKNDPQTREFAIFSHDEIQRDAHFAWLEKNIQYFQVVLGHGDNPIGAIRIQDEEISIWVESQFRQLGVATKIIERVSFDGMKAKIVDGNVSSMRAFVQAGFIPVDHVDNYYILQK